MRQIFTFRFLLTLFALLALLGVVKAVASSNSHNKAAVAVGEPAGRSVDFIALVQTAQLSPSFAMVDGRANTDLFLTIDGTRTCLLYTSDAADE